MKNYQTNEIKNLSLMGASGSGKTTLAETMLYESGVIQRRRLDVVLFLRRKRRVVEIVVQPRTKGTGRVIVGVDGAV